MAGRSKYKEAEDAIFRLLENHIKQAEIFTEQLRETMPDDVSQDDTIKILKRVNIAWTKRHGSVTGNAMLRAIINELSQVQDITVEELEKYKAVLEPKVAGQRDGK